MRLGLELRVVRDEDLGFEGVNGRNEGVGEEEMNDFLRVEREKVEEEEEKSVAMVEVLVVGEQ